MESTPSRGRSRTRKRRGLDEEEDDIDSDMPGTPSSMASNKSKPVEMTGKCTLSSFYFFFLSFLVCFQNDELSHANTEGSGM